MNLLCLTSRHLRHMYRDPKSEIRVGKGLLLASLKTLLSWYALK